MFVTQNQSKEIFTIIYTKTFSILCVKKKNKIKEERVGEAYRFSFPSTVEYIFHRLITPAVKQHQGGMLPGLTYFLSQWFTSAWDHCYCSIPPTKLAL
jgi:hypothetical protein